VLSSSSVPRIKNGANGVPAGPRDSRITSAIVRNPVVPVKLLDFVARHPVPASEEFDDILGRISPTLLSL